MENKKMKKGRKEGREKWGLGALGQVWLRENKGDSRIRKRRRREGRRRERGGRGRRARREGEGRQGGRGERGVGLRRAWLRGKPGKEEEKKGGMGKQKRREEGKGEKKRREKKEGDRRPCFGSPAGVAGMEQRRGWRRREGERKQGRKRRWEKEKEEEDTHRRVAAAGIWLPMMVAFDPEEEEQDS